MTWLPVSLSSPCDYDSLSRQVGRSAGGEAPRPSDARNRRQLAVPLLCLDSEYPGKFATKSGARRYFGLLVAGWPRRCTELCVRRGGCGSKAYLGFSGADTQQMRNYIKQVNSRVKVKVKNVWSYTFTPPRVFTTPTLVTFTRNFFKEV